MKNLLSILLIAICCITATTANAQCTPDNTMTDPGLYPKSDSLPCIHQNLWQQFTIQFKNYTTYDLNGTLITIDSVTIDTIGNMPNGYSWISSSFNTVTNKNTFDAGENGCITFAGVTTSSPGQYKLDIRVTAWVAGTAIKRTSDQLNLRYDVRVVPETGTPCPAIDTNAVNQVGVVAPTYAGANGIADISNAVSGLNNYPNPFNGNTEVVFSANESANYTFRVFNILGAEVHNEAIRSVVGQNIISFDAKNLESGVYFYSVGNGKSALTSKMVVNK